MPLTKFNVEFTVKHEDSIDGLELAQEALIFALTELIAEYESFVSFDFLLP